MSTSTATSTTLPDPRRWLALSVLALVQFMLIVDVSIVNVALTTIQKDLGFTRSGLTWVVDGYVLTAGGLLLLGGRLADLLGRRRMFLVGLAVFTLASILSGAAQDPGMLVASRFLQGAGEALCAPAAFGLVALLFTDSSERAKALGVFGGMAGLGGTSGPILSGLLVQASWRWIFFVNVPVALFAMFAVIRLVDESRADKKVREGRPDIVGALLITLGLTGVVYGLIKAAEASWSSTEVLLPLILGVALIASFVGVEAKIREPLVPLNFFRNRTRVTANVVTLFFSSVFFTMFFLLTLYFEQVKHYSALKTGVSYLPFGVVIALGIGLSSTLVPRLGVKPIMGTGFILYGIGMALMSRITVDGSYWSQPFPALVLCALGSGMAFAGFVNAAVHEVSGDDASLASGVQNATQQIGGAIGLAVLATIAIRHAKGAAKGAVEGSAEALKALTDGYVLVFQIGAVVMAVGAVLIFALMEHVNLGSQPETSASPAVDNDLDPVAD